MKKVVYGTPQDAILLARRVASKNAYVPEGLKGRVKATNGSCSRSNSKS